MSTNRLTAISTSEESAGAGIRLDLVRLALQSAHQLLSPAFSKRGKGNRSIYHKDANIEFLRHMRQLAQELI